MPTPAAVPVFFSPEMVADSGSYSPSAEKPAAVVARWQSLGLPVRLERPVPVDEATLALAHDRAYVRGVLAGRVPNGFGNHSAAVAASLPWTCGAMLSAARAAIASAAVAAAPCSGFHHAAHAEGLDFCTFNGLMVAACALRAAGLARRVAIVDCDMHYGDGTEAILDAVPGARGWVRHFTAGDRYVAATDAPRFLADLPAIVRGMADCDVILYQAGADPHVDDPLGGFLTTAELRARDAIVFGEARALGVPVAWNLAGGYQRDAAGGIEPVLAIHANTMAACAAAWGL